jgi:hypothetical protein
MKSKFLLLILLSSLSFAFWNCNGNGDNNNDDSDTLNVDLENNEHAKKVKKIFYNVPSPIEMSSLIQKSGAQYKPEILNPVSNVTKYISVTQQALALGVYGSDLSYVRMFEQIQLSVNYLSGIKKLCDGLNIPEDQGSVALARLEENIENRDSLLQIISETYAGADAYLKENDRGNTAVLIILGGWVEALYIATNIVDFSNPKNRDLIDRIGEQKYSLQNLMELVKSYPEDPELQAFLVDLEDLKKQFDNVQIDYVKGDIVTEPEKKLTTIYSKAIVTISQKDLENIKQSVTAFREKIVNF